MEWKDMVDLQRELVKMGAKLSIVQRENARLKEELAKKEHDYRLLGEYYECAIQREDELADLMWEKEEEIELSRQQIDMYIEKEQKYQDKLVEAGQRCHELIVEATKKNDKIKELETQIVLLQQQKCRAEGKLERCENYLRMFTGRENW